MQFYKFPEINTIDDVTKALTWEGDDKRFTIAKKDGYSVVNYRIADNDTFPCVLTSNDGQNKIEDESEQRFRAMRRECRGLIFNEKGEIISRRFHKFFNVNERHETMIENMDVSLPHLVMEKIDGSMVTPVIIKGEIRWASKMGLTDITPFVENFVKWHPQYNKLAMDMFEMGYTPIFEYCSTKNRVVMFHPKERLVLLACRHTNFGDYFYYEVMKEFAEKHKVDYVKRMDFDIAKMEKFVETTRAGSLEEDGEGYVLQYDVGLAQGHMVKIKTDAYLALHRAKERMRTERHLVDVIVNNQTDDLVPLLMDEELEHLFAYTKTFWDDVSEAAKNFEHMATKIYQNEIDRKDFALNHSSHIPTSLRPAIFQLYNIGNMDCFKDVDGLEFVVQAIQKGTQNNKWFEQIRTIIPNCKWDMERLSE